MIGIILFTTLFQMFFTHGGETYFQSGILKITSYGF